MTETWETADEEYFEEIFEELDAHSDWEYADTVTDREEAAEHAVKAIDEGNGRMEFLYNHSETGASLIAGIPVMVGEEPYALAGVVAQGQTRADDRDGDKLASSLRRAQGGVSRVVVPDDERYVSPVRDLREVAKIEVPFNYDEQDLTSGLDALSRVSEAEAEMHGELYDLLHGYAEQ